MSLDPTKIYVISSSTGAPQVVILLSQNPCTTSTDPIVGVQTASQPKWRLTETAEGSNVYTIALADDAAKHLYIEDNLLWLSASDASQLSIEPAGTSQADPVYRIHIPDQNQVCRLPKEGAQVDIAAEGGTPDELWFFDAYQHA